MFSMTTKRAALAAAVAVAMLTVGCGGDDDATADFCERYRAFEEKADENVIDESEAEGADLEEVKATFQEQMDALEELADIAPEAIAGDIEAQRSELEPVNRAVQSATTPEDVVEAFAELGEAADADDVKGRGDRIDDWIKDNCDADGAR